MNVFVKFSLVSVLLCGCSLFTTNAKKPTKSPKLRDLSTYKVNFRKSIFSRIKRPPLVVLEYLNDLDKTKYKPHVPNRSESILVRDAIAKLPPKLKETLKSRLVGIYFINDFLTNGMMDYVAGPNNKLYGFLIFRSSVLKKDISELLTQKEKTAFKKDGSKWSVRLAMGKRASALHYILLHEAIHLMDLKKRITPWVEPATKPTQLKNKRSKYALLVDDVWKGYRAPHSKHDFSYRKDITFYGFSKGPKLTGDQIPNVYLQLAKSPFVSLYGAGLWPEDVAELLTFYALQKYHGMELRIQVLKNNKVVKTHKPLQFPRVKKRLLLVKNII